MDLEKKIKLLKSLTVAVQDIPNNQDREVLTEVNKLFNDNKLDVCYIVAEW